MQFVQNGPDIPDALLQAHEEGRVVFFCGAGISYPAGLPGFKELVEKIYDIVGEHRTAIEDRAFQHRQLDATLDILEHRLRGGRPAMRMRKALAEALKPNLRRKGATQTHAALLQLARSRKGVTRLVTTNFDRIFEHILAKSKANIPTFHAPLLPIPKNSRWNGLVYLHGLLPPDESAESLLSRLVVTSGDFGLAYLAERWAARFVSDLLKNYVVCFVGYTINDPILRYMMDALAADRALGEITPQAYSFGECPSGHETRETEEWEAKGVIPILYEVSADRRDHSALHKTLKAWAETYRDGVQGKERIVTDSAMSLPTASTKQDDFIGRMLWALSDKSGRPAQRFADLEPIPSLEWLDALSKYRYYHADLPRFQVPVGTEPSATRAFSLLHRPAPYDKAAWMTLVTGIGLAHHWDDVMYQMARWLTRHLDDPKLLLWLAEQGGKLDGQFIQTIESKLDELANLERDDKADELARISNAAPRAIPRPMMRTLWRLFLSGRIKTQWQEFGIYQWQQRFQRDGLTFAVRMDLRSLLTPTLKLNRPFTWGAEAPEHGEPEDLRRSISWTLELAGTDVHSFLHDLENSPPWQAALPSLATDFQQLLRDALDLMHELGEADEHEDPSGLYVSSLCSPRRRFRFNAWVTLVDLTRDAWLAVLRDNPQRARQTALSWFAEPFPIFKRLGLFAATREGIDLPVEWLNCLLADQSRYLWAGETKSETLLLLQHKGNTLSDGQREQIEAAILTSPPEVVFRSEADPERIAEATDWLIWERLASLARSCPLSDAAQGRLNSLTASHPSWQLETDIHNEASPPGMGSGWDEFESLQRVDHAPRTRRELVEWLRCDERRGFFETDDWSEVCGARMFVSSASLCDLAHEGLWPATRWRIALSKWRDGKLISRSWRLISRLVEIMPAKELAELTPDLSLWLEAAAQVLEQREDVFLDLCRRILEQPYPAVGDTDQSFIINHPIGRIVQALLNYWFRRPLSDNDGLPDDVGPLLTQVCTTPSDPYRAGRGILALHLITLFRVAPAWTQQHLLPLFNWSNPAEARALWGGFLWSPRHYRPLLVAFKARFLEAAHHYDELGDRAEMYAALLTYAALDRADTFTARELYDAFSSLPLAGLQASVSTLVRAQDASGEQREASWKNRIAPFWHDVWPKSHDRTSKEISEQLARLAIIAQGEFPAAVQELQDWFAPQRYPFIIIHLLRKSGLCDRFPQDAIQLLSAIIDEHSQLPEDLAECLKSIVQAWPEARHDTRYQRLDEYLHRKPGL